MNSLNHSLQSSITNTLSSGKELFWLNGNYESSRTLPDTICESMIHDASERLKRFAPLIMHYFPETSTTNGIIESPLSRISNMQRLLAEGSSEKKKLPGNLYIKRDSDLKVAGSVKARGGIYEVLKVTEDIAIKEGLSLECENLISKKARELFSGYKIQVGSTGNLGMSIGIMSAALGYEAIVHMSSDAKQWKKDLLRSKGVNVIEYDGDYSQAVKSGRSACDADDSSHFVDDESSVDLFLGYAVAAERLKIQLINENIIVDEAHPLFVYIPCGVGGAPGGITYGLKQIFGKNVHCFFAEPTQAPCMLLGLVSGLYNNISVNDIGLSGKTAADGLAVGRCSGLVASYMDTMLSGEATVEDNRLIPYLRMLWEAEGIFIEPSSCAAFHAYRQLYSSDEGRSYLDSHSLLPVMDNSTHIIWATGGSLMPVEERNLLLNRLPAHGRS